MTLIVRRAGSLDCGAMADLLNQIIEIGGTTAMTTPITRSELSSWMASDTDQSAWHIAEDDTGALLGFQWIAPKTGLPAEACDIATFVQVGRTGLGTGSALFDATRAAARQLGYGWINATIRADNSSGLAYYQSRGFDNYQLTPNVPLGTGQVVDRVSKRYNL
ncbi:GNAT family N-acetyltransferase [Shimia sp.]|uniref:GNAT family N-acetyltransferase n=1 Tax=Shimia sp. TaxID=1954381 RepID=UPI003299B12F